MNKAWSSTAPPGEFRPYVPTDETIAEFTLRAVVLGALFGLSVWGGHRVCGTAGRADGVGVDSDFGAVDQYFAGVWALDDSRK